MRLVILLYTVELDCGLDVPGEVLASQVCNSGKVTDRHAVVPTRSASATDLPALPLGERTVLQLVSLALLQAVCKPYRYAEAAVVVECAGHSFSAKGKILLDAGWRNRKWRKLPAAGRRRPLPLSSAHFPHADLQILPRRRPPR